MFQIKTRVDYGLMIMMELAHQPQAPLPLSGLAHRLNISSAYLIQISQLLSKAGLITSKEGAQGGYRLARPAKQISLLAVIEALEGGIHTRCLAGKKKCPGFPDCRVRGVWEFVLTDVKTLLQKMTLASLLKKSL